MIKRWMRELLSKPSGEFATSASAGASSEPSTARSDPAASGSHFGEVFEATAEPLAILRAEEDFLRVEAINAAARTLLGADAGELPHSGTWKLIEEAARVSRSGDTVESVKLPFRDGSLRLYELRARPLSGPNVGVKRVLLAFREVGSEEPLLRTTLEHADQGVLMVDAAGIVQVCNRRAVELLNLPPEMMASKPSFEALTAYQLEHDEFSKTDPNVLNWVATHDIACGESAYERERPDGTVLEIRTRRLPGGGAVRTYTDVTARHRAEVTAREKADLLRITLDNMDQGLLVIDADRRVPLANRRVIDLLGLPEHLLLGGPSFDDLIAHQAEQGEFDEAGEDLRALIAAKGLYFTHHVYERRRPDGTVLEVRTVPLADGGAVRTFTNITARKEAEAALAESEARYRALADGLPQKVWVTNLDGSLAYFNRQVEEYHGRTPLTLGERLELNHPDDRPALLRARGEAFRDGRPFATTTRLLRRDGAYRWHRIAMVPLSRDGRIVQWVGTSLEIHDLIEVQEAAEVARTEAERANQAKSDFLATVSHEIRTPLGSILGYTDLLGDGALTDRQKRIVDRIQNAGGALLAAVNDILDLSKVEAGKMELDPRPFSPASLVEDAVSIVRGAAERKGLHLDVQVAPILTEWVWGDSDRLRQILLNLLNNAVKFTSQGSVVVKAEGADGAMGRRLRVSVTDSGPGIPEDKVGRLFQRFAQADPSIGRTFGGTGLGLAISKRLLDLMDGEIGAESRNGEGATFWFSLVLPKASGQDHGGRPALPPDAPARAARVLLADDLEENREIAKAYLEKAGHQVDVVADGAQAVAAVETGRYDLVLMDVRMPGVDGVAATHRIRALGPPTGDVPIIAFSANVLPEQVAEFRKAGMNGHLAKPVQREELQRLLQRWVSHRSDAGAGRQAASTGSGSAVIPSRPGQGEGAWASIEALAAYAESTFTKLLAALGPERVVDLVDKATSRLGSAFGSDPTDAQEAEALASDAHALIALLGMLGFERFSALCQALENACRSGDDLGPLLEAAQEARSRILDELPVLRGVASRAGTFQSGTAPRALSRRPT